MTLQRVGRYVLAGRRILGGFGEVMEAHEPGCDRRVAVKVPHAGISVSARDAERFRREADALQHLHHPNIVDFVAVGLEEGRPYFAMEWLDGVTLEDELQRRGALAPAEAWRLLEPLCRALAAAHERGVIHRDLKPSNVMLVPGTEPGAEATLKLIDFGLSTMQDPSDGGPALTSSGTCIGTPEYMAPEQILRTAVDARVDVYALGVLTYRMVTGREPFRGAGPDVIMSHLDAPPPLASDVAPDAAVWDAVIARCLAKRPERRWQAVVDVARALEAALTTAATAPGPLTIQLEISAEHWRAVDRALTLAENYAAAQRWVVIASADNGMVMESVEGRPSSAVAAACQRLGADIADRTDARARFLVRAGATILEEIDGGSDAT